MVIQGPFPPPLRAPGATDRPTKVGVVADGELRCPDHRTSSLRTGSGTVRRCRRCGAEVVAPDRTSG